MHSAIVVNDEASLDELNQLLTDEGWWVSQIAPGNDGSWLVILSDQDPNKLLDLEDMECGHTHAHEH